MLFWCHNYIRLKQRIAPGGFLNCIGERLIPSLPFVQETQAQLCRIDVTLCLRDRVVGEAARDIH